MRTALYLRISTDQQKPDLQTDGLRRYATRAGLEIVAEYRLSVAAEQKTGLRGADRNGRFIIHQ